MTIQKQIHKYIEQYDRIIIHRHLRPDMDAIGSQVGLATVLKTNYPEKEIYMVGDVNDIAFRATMDEIGDDRYQDALAIIVDVAVTRLISDDRYCLADKRIIIDHHQNDTDVEDVAIYYKDTGFSSAAEMIVDFVKTCHLDVTPEAATYLYGGMVTDTGRFLYMVDPRRTFSLASYISEKNPDIQSFYDFLYTETLQRRQTKNLFTSFEMTTHGVAYRKNTHALIVESGLDFQAISRGMVNQMAGIKEVPIWANFTEDIDNHVIVGEFRSRGIIIVDIAKKYGGGGHNKACGASLKNWQEVDMVLQDLDERAKTHARHS